MAPRVLHRSGDLCGRMASLERFRVDATTGSVGCATGLEQCCGTMKRDGLLTGSKSLHCSVVAMRIGVLRGVWQHCMFCVSLLHASHKFLTDCMQGGRSAGVADRRDVACVLKLDLFAAVCDAVGDVKCG